MAKRPQYPYLRIAPCKPKFAIITWSGKPGDYSPVASQALGILRARNEIAIRKRFGAGGRRIIRDIKASRLPKRMNESDLILSRIEISFKGSSRYETRTEKNWCYDLRAALKIRRAWQN